MLKSESISKIAVDLVKAQSIMSNPLKGSLNPFFKTKYADLSSVLESCIEALNQNNICVLQPMVTHDSKNYVQTMLLHSSGEYIGSETEIKNKDINNPQAEGSGITYARRYGLQSLISLGSEDDDGNKASRKDNNENKSKNLETKTEVLPDQKSVEEFFKTVADRQKLANAYSSAKKSYPRLATKPYIQWFQTAYDNARDRIFLAEQTIKDREDQAIEKALESIEIK